ncbi:expressed protein [Batrachochytrium dendrobatidis JAM81]|uniref:Expressed protein n=1 Tax=Batrachochytrium dendrobatidis (strain JAM81 / FGSC 10211) TaxID=684364 RepID=F4NX08_BATDJ|nr:uncharacterized protein BATDEDRAFT_36674 [Batrachochytrium dendrobatidis JAM81]EGF82908.1 expressed protein [Batrachochytrium dendrobatidis JAM81]|eukprot:XP_006676867.1 expressed protein [Batrachochytrium dendrobatidis JAM81]
MMVVATKSTTGCCSAIEPVGLVADYKTGSLLVDTLTEYPLCDGSSRDQLQRMGLACCTCNKWDCWIQSTHHQIQE